MTVLTQQFDFSLLNNQKNLVKRYRENKLKQYSLLQRKNQDGYLPETDGNSRRLTTISSNNWFLILDHFNNFMEQFLKKLLNQKKSKLEGESQN